MPIIEPPTSKALGLFPYQINPHYINQKTDGYHGETRDQRLSQFIILNPDLPIIALPEGTAVQLNRGVLKFIGECAGVMFQAGEKPGDVIRKEIPANTDLSFLL